jgi:hypothetical protein
MLFHINLLPPEKKEEVHNEMQARRLTVLCAGVIFILFFFAAELFFIKHYVSILFNNLSDIVAAESSSSTSVRAASIEDDIKKLNTAVRINEYMLADRMLVNKILDAISLTMPDEIYLTKFTYNAEGKQVIFSGFSPTRAKFVLFINKLKEFRESGSEKELFADFSSQVPYLSKQTAIEFDMSMKIRQ